MFLESACVLVLMYVYDVYTNIYILCTYMSYKNHNITRIKVDAGVSGGRRAAAAILPWRQWRRQRRRAAVRRTHGAF